MDAKYAGLAAVFGMGAVTYLTRVAGVVLMDRVGLSPKIEGWLRHVPGSVLVALVVPGLVGFGVTGAIAGAVTILVSLRFGNLVAAIMSGVGVVFLARALGFT